MRVGARQQTKYRPALEPREESWRKRFLDEDGNPLPADGVRVDVKTGEKLGRVQG